MIKILFLSANPSHTSRLRLDEEHRSIELVIRQSEYRDQIDIQQHWAVRVDDLQELLLRHKPDIVHFSGHANVASEIILQDEHDVGYTVTVDALRTLFSILKDNIKCVVLNACYSEKQALAIASEIDFVVGMSNNITDQAAIQFAKGFYRGIGYARSVYTAFKLGCLQIQFEKSGEENIPVLHSLAVNSENTILVHVPSKQVEVINLKDQQTVCDGFTLNHPLKHLPEEIQIAIDKYLEQIKEKLHVFKSLVALSLETQSTTPAILSYAIFLANEFDSNESNTKLDLVETILKIRQITLVGESGSGKTSALHQLTFQCCQNALNNSKDAIIPIYINLAGYGGKSLVELIHNNIPGISNDAIELVLEVLGKNGKLMFLFDDFDLAKSEHLSTLIAYIKALKAEYATCCIIVATHRPHDGHRLSLPTFRLKQLSREQAHKILSNCTGLDNEDALRILESFPVESTHLIETPLTLLMIAYIYRHSRSLFLFRSRGILYEKVVNSIFHLGEAKGIVEFERSDKILILSLLANWMLENEVYFVTPNQLSVLIEEWIKEENSLVYYFREFNRLRLRTELLCSGLLYVSVDDQVQFTHDSFRSYFAALTLSPNKISNLFDKPHWQTAIIFLSSLASRQDSDTLLEMSINNPILLAQIVLERTEYRKSNLNRPPLRDDYFERLKHYLAILAMQYPILEEKSVQEFNTGSIKLTVAETSAGYLILWEMKAVDNLPVDFVSPIQLYEVKPDVNDETPFKLSNFLLPKQVMNDYHPIEIANIITKRCLFDLLNFTSVSGGFNENGSNTMSRIHPAVTKLASRYMLYQALATRLPVEIYTNFPFYASQEYDLYIEVHDYVHPYFVDYKVLPAHKAGTISIVQSILKQSTDKRMFVEELESGWLIDTASETRWISTLESIEMSALYIEDAGNWATKQIDKDLINYLPGYPPEAW